MHKYKQTILCVLTALWCVVIWCFSLSSGAESAEQSTAVLELCNGFFAAIGSSLRFTAHFLRKAAHFSEFLILGLLGCATARTMRLPHAPWLSLAFCATVASIDELLQCFVPGRTPSVLDVLLDTLGAACGVALLWGAFCLFFYLKENKNKKF